MSLAIQPLTAQAVTSSRPKDIPPIIVKLTSHSVLSTTLPSSSDAALTALLLSLLALTVLGLALRKALSLRRVGEDEVHEAQYDPEAQTPTRNLILVPAPPGVGWTPQIRSVSCSTPAKGMDKKHLARPVKRARSPPPAFVSRGPDPSADSTPKSAPPSGPAFPEKDLPQSNEFHSPLSSPLTPRALAVTGLESRGLTRHAQARCS
ncbi:hypothetical protein BKA82DRAFT_993123 [Pisolithus tinctorius]|uniref:Uncharacterized protein n=1 Tax=Pisolithus tinctorius Marx 270 TaxID=870435 RepID=A0A0C3PX81_PISTI|nr:hypothetical protein BKA82DRAFT_993123 [Pisolithus tinctorius]KIO13564.1 hypothetical protein M404DRAFT_993123 [Pisolithus tinctorius Marx 270]